MTGTIQSASANHRPQSREWSILAQALALQESGILVQGMSVTDLSTGFCVEGPAEAMSPDYLLANSNAGSGKHSLGEDVALWGTNISVARLGELTVLLDEVVQQREANPDAASVNPATPRETFPWGIGLNTVDILVAGVHAQIVAAYLRVMGYRARMVNENEALRVATDRTASPHAVGLNRQHLASRRPDQGHSKDLEGSDAPESPGMLKAVIAVALAVVIVGVGAVATVFATGRDTSKVDAGGDSGASDKEKQLGNNEEAGPPPSIGTTPSSDPPRQPFGEGKEPGKKGPGRSAGQFSDPHKMGSGEERRAPRADVPIAVGVPGWKRAGATKGREEYRSNDAGMRVLIAAKPTPLQRQADLDQAVLKALEKVEGVRVVQQSPVVYEEHYPGSVTQWHVVLRAGHQMSVGCQVKERSRTRGEQCKRIVSSAHPE
ncbi:type VII secretion-associated protein [Corynebacterium auriscanis]|uniref:type VII secretion-associated protein n=1 Tax=Corynebacterium auriscanis TaxID=99807 RepID=UPI0024AD18B5|nr:type VII secretion-associated protein [Corynebacterium auriscanis]